MEIKYQPWKALFTSPSRKLFWWKWSWPSWKLIEGIGVLRVQINGVELVWLCPPFRREFFLKDFLFIIDEKWFHMLNLTCLVINGLSTWILGSIQHVFFSVPKPGPTRQVDPDDLKSWLGFKWKNFRLAISLVKPGWPTRSTRNSSDSAYLGWDPNSFYIYIFNKPKKYEINLWILNLIFFL
jgi:hypothetical protein